MRLRHAPPTAPALSLNLYGRAALSDPSATYAAIRQAGPVVWLSRHRAYAIGRFDDVRAALRDADTFTSGDGVGANWIANRLSDRTVLNSDGAAHVTRRRVMSQSLAARSLEPLAEQLQPTADQVVEQLLRAGTFDGVTDFASRLPVDVIAELVGVRVGTPRLLRWGRQTFDALGPVNGRALRAVPSSVGLQRYTRTIRRDRVTAGSWAATVFDAADRGEISAAEARTMIIDFVVPSLDTTILAAAQMLWQLGQRPDVWAELRSDPALVPAAVIESVRLASPVRAFTRRVVADTEFAGTPLPGGARVILLYGAANLDETRFHEPERFELRRPAGQHVGWGNGPHTCVGMHLAKLELQALLRAMIPRVDVVSSSRPRWLRNNCLQGLSGFDARFD